MIIDAHDPLAVEVYAAIQGGDVAALKRLLEAEPGLVEARIRDRRGNDRTLLHVTTDFPGQFPEGPAVVRTLIAAGADPNGCVDPEKPSETPLHWAASSDDLEVAEVLLDVGADIEAKGAVIAGGTPLDDACAFGCWNVAHLLVRRGAVVDDLWKAAALGLRQRVEELIAASPPDQEQLNDALWQACHGGQQRIVAYLLSLGGELDWHPDHSDATALEIAGNRDQQRDTLVAWLTERGSAPG